MEFTSVIKPGWVASAENIKELVKTVKESAQEAVAFVFDLFGKSSVRFKQFDGTMSLPFRSNGKYHLGGKVIVTPLETFKRIAESLVPILREKGNKPCVVIPPLP
jgi:hypothetical protein